MSTNNSYRSGFERAIAANLRARKVRFEYETLSLPYVIEKTYKPDFILPNGIIVEAKGVLTPDDRRKLKAIKKLHPHLDIRLLFQAADNRLNRNSKTTYSKWAESNGFVWAEGIAIPEDWIKNGKR